MRKSQKSWQSPSSLPVCLPQRWLHSKFYPGVCRTQQLSRAEHQCPGCASWITHREWDFSCPNPWARATSLWDSHRECAGSATVAQRDSPSVKGLRHLSRGSVIKLILPLHCQVRETVGRGRQTSGMIILSSHAFCLLVNKPNKMLGSNSICHASHIRIIQPEIESVQPPLEAVP